MPPTRINELRTRKTAFINSMRVSMISAFEFSAIILLDEMKRLTSLQDHTLRDLRDLGHPYRPEVPQGTPHDDYLVHIQSGDLQRGLRKTGTRATKNFVRVAIHSDSRHTWHLLLGTSRMRPRDFVSAAIINKERTVSHIIENAYRQVLGQFGGQMQGGFSSRTKTTLIPHGAMDAQLPQGEF